MLRYLSPRQKGFPRCSRSPEVPGHIWKRVRKWFLRNCHSEKSRLLPLRDSRRNPIHERDLLAFSSTGQICGGILREWGKSPSAWGMIFLPLLLIQVRGTWDVEIRSVVHDCNDLGDDGILR